MTQGGRGLPSEYDPGATACGGGSALTSDADPNPFLTTTT